MMRGRRENCGLVDLFWVKQAHLSASLAFGATLKSDLIFLFCPFFPKMLGKQQAHRNTITHTHTLQHNKCSYIQVYRHKCSIYMPNITTR